MVGIIRSRDCPSEQGDRTDTAYLQQLKDEGKSVVEIPKDRNLQDRAKLTMEAMQSGADVIYQAICCAGINMCIT
jgi:homoserine dehydrogenase